MAITSNAVYRNRIQRQQAAQRTRGAEAAAERLSRANATEYAARARAGRSLTGR